MSLRLKILLLTIGIVVFAVAGTARLIAKGMYERLVTESELRAVALIEGVALSVRDDLACERLDEIGKSLIQLRDPGSGRSDVIFTLILDGNGRAVGREVMPEYEQLLKSDFVRQATAASRELKTHVTFDGRDIVLVSIPVISSVPHIEGVRWGTVVGGMDIGRIEAAMFPLVRYAVGAALGFLLIGVFLLVLTLYRNLLSPINKLAEAASRFAAGDLKFRAPEGTADELGRLGATMNQMASDIEQHTRTLEDAVKARTRELEQANSRLHELAAMDELTGLGNRRTFTAALNREFRRARRDGSCISMLMLDVDHFKKYNDTHGHPAGDVALNKVGAILRNHLRVTDIPCRYGGEEFAVILCQTARDDGMRIADDIRRVVQQEVFFGEDRQPLGTFTVSIGVSTFPRDADDPDKLVDAADIALYQAKASGRNQVRGFEPGMTAKANLSN